MAKQKLDLPGEVNLSKSACGIHGKCIRGIRRLTIALCYDKKIDKIPRIYDITDFQDIHVMIFVGFAYLMTFLRRYGYSATGFNMFLGALVVQWAFLARGCFTLEDGYIK